MKTYFLISLSNGNVVKRCEAMNRDEAFAIFDELGYYVFDYILTENTEHSNNTVPYRFRNQGNDFIKSTD